MRRTLQGLRRLEGNKRMVAPQKNSLTPLLLHWANEIIVAKRCQIEKCHFSWKPTSSCKLTKLDVKGCKIAFKAENSLYDCDEILNLIFKELRIRVFFSLFRGRSYFYSRSEHCIYKNEIVKCLKSFTLLPVSEINDNKTRGWLKIQYFSEAVYSQYSKSVLIIS